MTYRPLLADIRPCWSTDPMEWPFRQNAQLSGRGDKFRGGLIVASNREPYSHRRTGRGLKLEISAGGLVSALDTVLRVTGGTWVAWGSGSGDREGADDNGRLWVPLDNPAYTLKRVWLSPDAVKNYYRGFCNLVLWPLFHGEPGRIRYRRHFWNEYQRSNLQFAETILQEAGADSTLWIHDYQLCLVPAMLRATNPTRTIAHFWHIPWPARELFIRTPHGLEIVEGLLGNDLIGFQIPAHARNFVECAEACLGATVDHEAMTVTWQGHLTRVRAFPISIDFNRFDQLAGSPATAERVEQLRASHRLAGVVGLAVDRLDYTKGITQRLQAVDLFFRRHPVYRGRFTLIQIAVMTRNGEPYLSYKREVEEMIAGVNSAYGTDEWQPVLYFKGKLDQNELVAWYHLADLALITPIRDGMNLVAKEYVASRHDGTGILILGRQTGAASELTEALQVDPNDMEGYAETIHRALTMPAYEKIKRMARLRKQVENNTVFHWVGDILDELAILPVTKRGGKYSLRFGNEISSRLAGMNLFLCLDFDGTLAPIGEKPETVALPECIRSLLTDLRQRHPIAIISGRSLKDLKSRVNLPGLVYCGNHGAEMGDNFDCAGSRHFLEEFIQVAHETFSSFPGVQVEDKGLTASIHFRRVEPVLLGEFLASFQEISRKFAGRVSVTEGRKVFEIRPPGAVGKGNAVRQLMEGVGKGRLPVYMGDDTSDEDAFRAVRGVGISIAVGGSPEADYYLRNQGEVPEFLKLLARIPLAGRKPYRATGGRKGSQQ